MKVCHRLSLPALSLTLALFFCSFSTSMLQADSHSSEGLFRHVVCFKFKEGTPEAKVKEIEAAFAALKDKVPTIVDFEWGRSESVEGLNDEFTHCFLVTFKDKAGLEAYLPHEDHVAFVDLAKPHFDKVFVFDYTAKQK